MAPAFAGMKPCSHTSPLWIRLKTPNLQFQYFAHVDLTDIHITINVRYFRAVFKTVSEKMLYSVQICLSKVKSMHNFTKLKTKKEITINAAALAGDSLTWKILAEGLSKSETWDFEK